MVEAPPGGVRALTAIGGAALWHVRARPAWFWRAARVVMSRFGSAGPAVWGWLRSAGPQRRYLGRDLLAGLPGAVSSVPDGMAAAVLVGVNPVQGLYASFAGPITGGLTANTRLMVITTTSASALAAGSALSGVPAAQRPAAVPLVAIIAGAALVAAGLLKLGRYTRFVSYSVMTGFLTVVAVNIVCGQVPDFTGAKAQGPFPLAKAFEVLIHPSSINIASLLAGLGALAILVVMSFTPWRVVSALVALVVPTVTVALAGVASVARVGDAGHIPPGIPLPRLPNFGLFSFGLVTGALAVAAIVFVQGAGWPRRRRTPTASRNRTLTSSPRGRAIWCPGSSGACRWGGRSARPRSTSGPAAAPGGRQYGPASGCW